MKACLMYPNRDFGMQQALQPHQRELKSDLELETLLCAMAADDQLIHDVAQAALMESRDDDVETVLYRQAILNDAMRNPEVTRELYRLTWAALEGKRRHYFGIFMNYPSGILHGAMDLMRMLLDILRKLRHVADAHASQFESAGFSTLLAMLQAEFSDEYFARIERHLADLRLKAGVLESARLGRGNEGTDYVLRKPNGTTPNWLMRLLRKGPPAYTFHIADRDEAGARALSELRDRGLNLVANALAQSTEHILSFFEMLRMELAFYMGCLNLRARLATIGAPITFPTPMPRGARVHSLSGLYDPCLALSMGRTVVGNTVDARGKSLVIVTGANQGGKSSFLRAVGVAQLMMQSGMYVAADSFSAELCSGLFSHYKREEDDTMRSGKFDEELARMSDLADSIGPDAVLLFNESFASTNEREGSEVARQIVNALLDRRIKVFFVTHLYDFAHGFFPRAMTDTLFLRAERKEDGTRTFRLIEGEPLETSYGEDLYREVFPPEGAEASVQ